MNLGDAAFEFSDDRHRINAAGFDPEHIDLEPHRGREFRDENVKPGLAAFLGLELEIVIVEADSQAGFVHLLGDLVEIVRRRDPLGHARLRPRIAVAQLHAERRRHRRKAGVPGRRRRWGNRPRRMPGRR